MFGFAHKTFPTTNSYKFFQAGHWNEISFERCHGHVFYSCWAWWHLWQHPGDMVWIHIVSGRQVSGLKGETSKHGSCGTVDTRRWWWAVCQWFYPRHWMCSTNSFTVQICSKQWEQNFYTGRLHRPQGQTLTSLGKALLPVLICKCMPIWDKNGISTWAFCRTQHPRNATLSAF